MGATVLFTVLGLGFASSLGACASDGAADGGSPPAQASMPVSCDPLAAKPITLGAIVGAATDANGTSYVDAANGVFVSSGDELDRQHVIGSGQSGSTEYLFDFEPPSNSDEAQAQSLLVETDASGAAQAMALGVPGSRAFLNQPDAGATMLTLVNPGSISGLPVVNTPNTIDYVGDVENGAVVLATEPMNEDETSDDLGLSIFYGQPGDVEERTITDFGESLSGNGSVTFSVDGESYVLAFGQVGVTSDKPFGDFALLGLTPGNGAMLAVTVRSPTPSALPAELSFSCLP